MRVITWGRAVVFEASLFGRMQITHDGREVAALSATKSSALFAYLLLHPGVPLKREVLADVVWGEPSGFDAQKAVRQELYNLCNHLKKAGIAPAGLMSISRHEIGLAETADLTVDLWLFNDLLDGVSAPSPLSENDVAHLEQAVGLYTGDLLPGVYFDWCQFARETARTRYLVALEMLMHHFFTLERWDAVIDIGRRLLKEDMILEYVHRTLMQAYYNKGCRASALRQYGQCRAALESVFEEPTEPMAETRHLYLTIRNETISKFDRAQAAPAHAFRRPDRPLAMKVPSARQDPAAISKGLREIADQIDRLKLPF